MATDDNQEQSFNPQRHLCPDGSCIGIIGGDGRCAVCGARDPGEPGPAPAEVAPMPSDAVVLGDDLDVEDRPGDDPDSAFDSNRRLCSDGGCVGVIGGDNLCSVCGKLADS